MLLTLSKPICLPEDYAEKLTRLATTFQVPESALLQEALDLLFQRDVEADVLTSWEYLEEQEAEASPLPPVLPPSSFNPDEIVSVVGTPIDPALIRRRGNPQ